MVRSKNGNVFAVTTHIILPFELVRSVVVPFIFEVQSRMTLKNLMVIA